MKANNVVISQFENEPMGNWDVSYTYYGAMRIELDEHYASVYIQDGAANIYYMLDHVRETEVGYMKPTEFNEWLLEIEKEYN